MFTEKGQGYSSIQNVLHSMNVHRFPTPAFTYLNEDLFVAYENAALKSIQIAGEGVCEIKSVTDLNHPFSIDGP